MRIAVKGFICAVEESSFEEESSLDLRENRWNNVFQRNFFFVYTYYTYSNLIVEISKQLSDFIYKTT